MTTLRAYIAEKLAQLTEWACFHAYNHAKRREHDRRKWHPVPQASLPDWNDDQRAIRGREAQQVLENRHFREAWEALNESLDASILACNVYAKDGDTAALRLVIAKQQLLGVRREFLRKMEDGIMSEVRVQEQRRASLPRVFRR